MAKSPFRNLIFLMQKHLSSSSTTPTTVSSSSSLASSKSKSKSSSFTVDYLVNTCGLTLQSAIATSQKLHLNENNIQRNDSILHLLKSHGFEDTHIAKLIQKFPTLLTNYKADENLNPKLDYLVENGFAGCRLHDLIVSHPSILSNSLRCRIKPSVEFLKSFLGTEERLILAVKRDSWLLSIDLERTLQPNIELFEKEGVPRDAIAQYFMTQPSKMQLSHERMLVGLKTYKDEFGISVASPNKFLTAVTTLASMDVSVWKRRSQLLESLLGCSHGEVLSLFRLWPTCFGLTDETLRSKVDFYFNIAQLKPEVIFSSPSLLSYSIDKRIRPRYNVLKLLLSKKLLREDFKLAVPFRVSEEKFLEEYVSKHLQQVPTLLEMYTNDKMKDKIDM